MSKKKALIKRTIENLNEAFIWYETQQGHDYWSSVEDNLLKVLEDEKVQ